MADFYTGTLKVFEDPRGLKPQTHQYKFRPPAPLLSCLPVQHARLSLFRFRPAAQQPAGTPLLYYTLTANYGSQARHPAMLGELRRAVGSLAISCCCYDPKRFFGSFNMMKHSSSCIV
jgi:hypothetical protein